MGANKRRLLHCVSKTVSIAGVRRSYGGVPQSNSKSPTSSSQRLMELESEFSPHK
ncbi:hypothetical protein ARALYDRAFT_915668 [Arabidopsis lyrata subsp. lyrata]|uniref:Uncharacterized protein n=1 Tax=Arabidopsis lyrata subsp. lyrata TaxID=81972 RepID=D7MHS0_ARALL|nr:hypothetical protein ARALYDRAFT_915668 [Arabidopsis lyrata subsp. lyrata]